MYSQEHKGYPTQNGVGSYPDQWSKTSHASSPSSDHAYRPVLADAERKKRPIVSYNPPSNGLSTRVEPVKTHLPAVNDRSGEPPVPVHHHVEEKQAPNPDHANGFRVHRPIEDNRTPNSDHANGYVKGFSGFGNKVPHGTSPPVTDYKVGTLARDEPVRTSSGGPEQKWGRSSSPNHRPLEDNRKIYPSHANTVPAKTYGGVPEEKWSRPSSPNHHPVEDSRKIYPNRANGFPAITHGNVPEEKWSRASSPNHPPREENPKLYSNRANGFPAKTYGDIPKENWGRPSSPNHWPPEDNRANSVPARTYGGAPEEKWRRPSSPSHYLLKDNRKTYPNHVNNVPAMTNNVREEKWSRTSSPIHHPLEDNRKPYPNYANGVPAKTYNVVPGEKWSSPADPKYNKPLEDRRKTHPDHVNGEIANPLLMSDYRQSSPSRTYPVQPHKPSSPTHHFDPDQPSHEFIRKVHTEVSRPRFGPLSASYWHHSPPTTTVYGYGDDLWGKVGQTPNKPPMITSGGWFRPSHATWASPPEGTLTRPTNDINTAMNFLVEATKPSPGMVLPSSRVTVPYSNGSKSDVYGAPVIDKGEGAKRYVNFSSRHTTIDSREAVRKIWWCKCMKLYTLIVEGLSSDVVTILTGVSWWNRDV